VCVRPTAGFVSGAAQLIGSAPNQAVTCVQAAIAESFEAAKQPPVHPTKPHLRAVDIMPVLPNTDRWGSVHVTVSHQGPILNVLDVPGSSEEERAALAARCVLRSYVHSAPPCIAVEQMVACPLTWCRQQASLCSSDVVPRSSVGLGGCGGH
jgi:Paf1